MTDANELQAQIAALAGRINRHKNASEVAQAPYNAYGRTSRDTSVVGTKLKQKDYEAGHNYNAPHWSYQRGTPYGAPRGRGHLPRAAPHRHRTLVLNNAPGQVEPTTGTPATITGEVGTGTSSGWVSKRDKSTMQLINNSVYEQKTQQRAQAIAKTREEQQKAKMARLEKHFNTLAGYSRLATTVPTTASPQVNVEDICFLVADGGSKLTKVKDDVNNLKTTPKQVKIAGVIFLRSKHGNLYRAGMIKTLRRNDTKKIQQPCAQFSTTGTCPKGPNCRFIHDPSKVAVCPDFLHKGECQAGINCDLSHDLTPERVPPCLHFLRGNCTNPDCRYTHIRVNPGAPVCRAFATLGYCSKGSACPERHVHECPDYANKGLCRKQKCRLPHVDRAGALRKAAAAQQEGGDTEMEDASDVSSDDEYAMYDEDDIDSEEEFLGMPTSASHELSQQGDYVKF